MDYKIELLDNKNSYDYESKNMVKYLGIHSATLELKDGHGNIGAVRVSTAYSMVIDIVVSEIGYTGNPYLLETILNQLRKHPHVRSVVWDEKTLKEIIRKHSGFHTVFRTKMVNKDYRMGHFRKWFEQ